MKSVIPNQAMKIFMSDMNIFVFNKYFQVDELYAF